MSNLGYAGCAMQAPGGAAVWMEAAGRPPRHLTAPGGGRLDRLAHRPLFGLQQRGGRSRARPWHAWHDRRARPDHGTTAIRPGSLTLRQDDAPPVEDLAGHRTLVRAPPEYSANGHRAGALTALGCRETVEGCAIQRNRLPGRTAMALKFIAIDPDTDREHCPAVFVEEET